MGRRTRPKAREVRFWNHTVGEAARARGQQSEESLLAALRKAGAPNPWFSFARKATEEEDAKGIDAVVFVKGDTDPLLFQAKSSHRNKALFDQEKRKGKVHCVVVSLDDEKTELRACEALEAAYAERAGNRVAERGV